MSVAIRGYTSIADSQSIRAEGLQLQSDRPVHGMLRQAPNLRFIVRD